MPNRILRDWTDSERINKLSSEGERFFIRLLMKVDDFGRFHANTKLLRSLMFPLKDGIRDTDISRWMDECQKAGLIAVYKSKDSKPLLEVQRFKQRSRAETSKFDAPPDTCASDDGQMTVIRPSSDGLDVFVCVGGDVCEGVGGKDSSELAKPPPSEPPVLEFQCNGNLKTWPLTKSKIDEWQALYPGVNVLRECQKAAQWLRDNPRKRKTAFGMLRFLSNWISRTNDRLDPLDGRAPKTFDRAKVEGTKAVLDRAAAAEGKLSQVESFLALTDKAK